MTTTKSDTKKAVVIGSGFGGLSMAIQLQAAGYETTIVEAREKIGGRAYQIQDSGYTFDMGPSLITAPSIIDRVFQTAGRSFTQELNPVRLDPYYRVHFADDTHMDYSGDRDFMVQQMAQFSQRDADHYDDYMDATQPIYEAVIEDGLGSQPFDTLGKLLKFVPKVLQLGAWRTNAGFANKHFKDFRHRFLFSFHPLFIGGNPFNAPAVYQMIPYLEKKEGVWYTPGGMYALASKMAEMFEDLGGVIHCNSPVDEIMIRDGKAVGVTVGGTHYMADFVVSNADVGTTYSKMIAPEHRRKYSDKKVNKTDYSMSCFLLYLGIKKKYPNLEHHTIILAERYKELLRDIFKNKVLADDFSLYLHTPSVTDATMAPDGSESMYILAPVPNQSADIDWDEVGDAFRDRLVEFLQEWGLDELADNIEVEHRFTPNDFESQLQAMQGNAFGIEPKLLQTAYFRPHNRSEDIENLYFVGAGTHPGAGVPGVLLSAEATMYCVNEDFGQAQDSETIGVLNSSENSDEFVGPLPHSRGRAEIGDAIIN